MKRNAGRVTVLRTPLGDLEAGAAYHEPGDAAGASACVRSGANGASLHVRKSASSRLRIFSTPLPADELVPAPLREYSGILVVVDAYARLSQLSIFLKWRARTTRWVEWQDDGTQAYHRLSYFGCGTWVLLGTLDNEGLFHLADEGEYLPSRYKAFSLAKYDPDILPFLPFINCSSEGVKLILPDLQEGERVAIAFAIAVADESETESPYPYMAVKMVAGDLFPRLDALESGG